MKKSILRQFLTIFLCIGFVSVSNYSHAQVEPTEDLGRYFDDGGMSQRKNIISTNLLAPIYGELGLRYERALSKRFSIEVGIKKMAPFYVWELFFPIDYKFNGFAPQSGWGYSIYPHFFFWDKAPEFHFMGPRFAQRTHVLEYGAKLRVTDFTLNYGYNLFLTKKLMFCYDIGIGYRRMNFDATEVSTVNYRGPLEEASGIIYSSFSIGLGIIF